MFFYVIGVSTSYVTLHCVEARAEPSPCRWAPQPILGNAGVSNRNIKSFTTLSIIYLLRINGIYYIFSLCFVGVCANARVTVHMWRS